MPKKNPEPKTAPGAPLAYEQAFARLEALVETLEDGKVPLAELVAKFEEGHKLLKICQEHLQTAELKIEQLKLHDGGKAEFAPFEEESES